MSGNPFNVGGPSTWSEESTQLLGQRFLRTLDELAQINRHFQSWGITDLEGPPRETGFFRLEDVRSTFSEIVERGVSKDDFGDPDPRFGYTISAFNHFETLKTDTFSVGLRATGAGTVPGLSTRGARFDTGSDKYPDPEIVAYPVFKSVLLTLVQNWELTFALAHSAELSREWDYPRFNFDLPWMLYLSAPLASQIVPPPDICVEYMRDGGLLMIAAEETFDTNNADHMTAAYRIRDTMAPLNDLEEHERKKRETAERWRRLKASGFPGELVHGRRKPFP